MLTTTAREIKNLKMLNHENIVPLLEMVVERKAGKLQLRIFEKGLELILCPSYLRRIRSQHLPGLSLHGARSLRIHSFDRVNVDRAKPESLCRADA